MRRYIIRIGLVKSKLNIWYVFTYVFSF